MEVFLPRLFCSAALFVFEMITPEQNRGTLLNKKEIRIQSPAGLKYHLMLAFELFCVAMGIFLITQNCVFVHNFQRSPSAEMAGFEGIDMDFCCLLGC